MTDKLLSFHGKQETKDFYVERVRAHGLADEIKKGFYWERGKGCAVGCTIHGSDHGAYEVELGIPRQLARVEDGIFESLPNGKAKGLAVGVLTGDSGRCRSTSGLLAVHGVAPD